MNINQLYKYLLCFDELTSKPLKNDELAGRAPSNSNGMTSLPKSVRIFFLKGTTQL